MNTQASTNRLFEFSELNNVCLTADEIVYLMHLLRTKSAVEIENLRIIHSKKCKANECDQHPHLADLIHRVSLKFWGTI